MIRFCAGLALLAAAAWTQDVTGALLAPSAANFPYLRGEALNFLDHTNFDGPNTALSVQVDPAMNRAVFHSPGFGLITPAKSSRFIQLVARFEF